MKNNLLDHKSIQWPLMPQRIPSEYGLSKRRDFRHKQMAALFILSLGYSVAVEIYTLLGRRFGVNYRSGSFRNAILSLEEIGALRKDVVEIQGLRVGLSLVKLTKYGRKLCYELGWPPYEAEWGRMKRLHEKGKSEPAHTCATLAFAYQARLRGCRAGVIPKIETVGQFAPDAIILEGDRQVLVEVELGYEKIDKWKNMHQSQGFVAFCTNSVTHRNTLKRECQSLGIPGRATDLRTLFLTSKDESPCPLWLDEWK
jgi:hypothetical protein